MVKMDKDWKTKTDVHGKLLLREKNQTGHWINSHREPGNGDPSSWGLDEGVKTPHRKKRLVTKCFTGHWNWSVLLRTRKWTFGFHKRRRT